MNILITGGNGYVAKAIHKYFSNSISITRKDFDLTDREATNKWFENKYFDVVIHTAVVGGSRLKKDDGNTFYQNIQIFYNLLNNKHCFNKLISFGSGAELNMPTSPYGLSKNVINKIITQENNFYNLRIYAVFDENELDTRFIKSNILRYINKQPIQIHQNILMDFIYMKDLIKLVEYFINETELPKSIDCSYNLKYSLLDISCVINNLSSYEVEINGGGEEVGNYIGKGISLNLELEGLENGIKNTYKKLLNETN